jgi:murein DD-endopeptidase MepM/ murein hydrolase activator NlpD
MPLEVDTLRDSDLRRRSTGDEFKAAVILWAACWHQVPAGSLPDDDIELADLAAIGTGKAAVRAWAKVKAMALRGWFKASDGRLYHPVMSKKALMAWNAKLLQRERTIKARIASLTKAIEKETDPARKASLQADLSRAAAELSQAQSQGQSHGQSLPLSQGVSQDQSQPPRDRKGSDRIGSDRIGRDDSTSPPSPAAPARDPAAAAANLDRRVRGYDPKRLLVAIEAGDLLAVVATFGGNLERGDEWTREATNQRIGTIAAIFEWRMDEGSPIREPSGLRQAIVDWMAKPIEWRKKTGRDLAAFIGLPVLSRGAEAVPGAGAAQ